MNEITSNERREQDAEWISKHFTDAALKLDPDDLEWSYINYDDIVVISEFVRKQFWLWEKSVDIKKVDSLMFEIWKAINQQVNEQWETKFEPYLVAKVLSNLSETFLSSKITKSKLTLDDQSKADLNKITLALWDSPRKQQIIELFEKEMSIEGNEEKLLKYATEGYKELYAKYKKEWDFKRLEQLQNIEFINNEEKWWIEVSFNKLWLVLSEQLLWFQQLGESKNIMEWYNWYYRYPTLVELQRIINICPWEDNNEDMKIFKEIIWWKQGKWIFLEESFSDEKPIIFNVWWTLWEKKADNWIYELLKTWEGTTFWIRTLWD